MSTPRRPLATSLATLLVALVSALIASCAVPPPQSDADRVPLEWSGATRPDFTDIAYGPLSSNVADVYLPVSGGNRGVIVLVHGGAFVGGSRDEVRRLSGVVMSQVQRGFAVVNVAYRLTTPVSNFFPAAVDDASSAVDWVRVQGPSRGLNPSTIIIAGHSAGATTAALVGLGWNSPEGSPLGRTARVDGYISFAGVMDFETAAPLTNALGKMWLGPNMGSAEWLRSASPVSHFDSEDPPGYVAQGDRDDLVEPAQVDPMVRAVIGSKGPYTRLFIDRVNTGAEPCRWHLPMCGVNATELNRWIDLVEQRAL